MYISLAAYCDFFSFISAYGLCSGLLETISNTRVNKQGELGILTSLPPVHII